jgi:hypothetical protein
VLFVNSPQSVTKDEAVPYHEKQALKGSRGISLTKPDSGARMGKWSTLSPRHFSLRRETRYPFHRRLLVSRGRSGCVQKMSTPPRSEYQTVPARSNRYTDYAISPASVYNTVCIIRHVGWIWRSRRPVPFAIRMPYRIGVSLPVYCRHARLSMTNPLRVLRATIDKATEYCLVVH